ncbi:nitrilase-related carbon-nitrogen hydrolase [Spongiactinospora sp. TRM90649]|uniref:nitrilase-related carbon-nitrogen hydrolase n=1 Tax=Spongiactinospora sp. TRM90649 TaxID=3031114 RepID=UPI0023F7EFAB|nr:nitrilase-related carbon-nitrogen hydrolase [Spongiactinospora sp. TRM90649]MDF5754702.1 nitrilase-related carbon-nitrogen hydrolase [Spongiactinospora sp. TRM90649]
MVSVREPRAAWQVSGALAGTAVLFYLGTGLAPVAALTWVAPLPALLLAPRVPGWAAAGVAFLGSLLGTANIWAFQLRSHDMPMWPAGIMINTGMSAVLALAVLAFGAQMRRGRPLLAVLAAPAVWTGALYLVSVSNPMGLLGTFANHQGDMPLIMQAASVTGMWGVDFLVMLAPSAVAALATAQPGLAARLRATAVATALLAVALGAGALRLAGAGGETPVLRVAAISTNQRDWAPDLATPAARDLATAYAEAIAALPEGVTLAVLPEAAVGSTEAAPKALFEPMRRVARERGIDIVAGFAHWDDPAKYNYALTFPSDGGAPVTYLKHHDSASVLGHDLSFPPVASGARVGVMICGDVTFRDPGRQYAAAGARLMAMPASTEDDNGWQMARTALLRGVENGEAIVWASRTGKVMISDGYGRVVAEQATGGPAPFTTVVADVRPGPGATPYTRLGDWFAWLCLALTAVTVLTAIRRPRDRRAGDQLPPRDRAPAAPSGRTM